MEVSVYMSLDAMREGKALFKRVVLCPDVFVSDSFVKNMKAIFGESVLVNVLYL